MCNQIQLRERASYSYWRQETNLENIRKQLVHTSFLFPKMQKRPWVLNALSNWIEQLKHLGSEHLSCSPNFPHASYLDERSWRMNQLLISVHLIQELLFSFSLFPSILVQIVFCFEISQASFLSFLFSFLGFITKKLYGFWQILNIALFSWSSCL